MIRLTELLHSIHKEDSDGLTKVDDWKFPDAQHLIDMKFEIADDHHFKTGMPPKMTVYRKRIGDKCQNKKEETHAFHLEEEGKTTKRFSEFNDLIEYFATYENENNSEEDEDLNKNR